MAKFEVGQDVVLRGRVVEVDGPWDNRILVQTDKWKHWLREESLELDVSPSPIMVKCDKCGVERPLTELKTLRDRCKALGLPGWNVALDKFMVVCDALDELGVTVGQFREGL